MIPTASEMREKTINRISALDYDGHITVAQEIANAAREGIPECVLDVDNWPVSIVEKVTATLESLGYKIEVSREAHRHLMRVFWGPQ